ncbi:hypothetical protein GCM10009853_031990 [Glycomyces scopariae]
MFATAIIGFFFDYHEPIKNLFENPPPLEATITQYYAGCDAAVFPEDKAEEAAPFLAETELPTSGDPYTQQMLELGASAVGSIRINFELNTTSSKPVTVYDIQFTDVQTALPLSGSLIDLVGCQGDSIDQMVMAINSPHPGPFAFDEETNQQTEDLFFESNVINVGTGSEEQHVGVLVEADSLRYAGSYSFRLKVLYEVDGEHRTLIVDRAGEPFLLTSGVCNYDAITARTFNDDYGSVDPETHVLGDCWENN